MSGEEAEGARPRRGLVIAPLALVLVVGALLAFAFVPRTIASGGDGAWEVRGAPGVFAPVLRVVTEEGTTGVSPDGPELAGSSVLGVPPAAPDTTLVVGPVPREAASVRVASEQGVGESRVQRLAWRRVHLAVLEGDREVRELVGISRSGRVLEVVEQPDRR